MLTLRSERVLVLLDPDRGGEILDLFDLCSGRQLLGRIPFSTDPYAARGDLDEPTWTAGYRGGWQLLTPNAGNATEFGGEKHGFHGRASAEPWSVKVVDPSGAVLSWEGHGLTITRELSLVEPGSTVVLGRVCPVLKQE